MLFEKSLAESMLSASQAWPDFSHSMSCYSTKAYVEWWQRGFGPHSSLCSKEKSHDFGQGSFGSA
ncbi:MAG: hypothetical protein A2758_00100 [Candidatus Zambryskibacteria bacterium RIFCSPHIGHO2_01_FULL_49_18]|uniref:Uncharacterized protein n=1 Tax=Candidatus Zambryskibacteria bacterium RIFCSPHIGHO2_01_FULL_49_18 TaxID=1802740 RepID=A0A1G2T3W3_9BACT|nr:MAG: hypothetical protein A2758_00100 [Candidatus Zambryskibacteria bacterium RIFCSPHIGHO2_01_FULL_49_18]